MDICTLMPGCEASKLATLALKASMLGLSVWNSQNVTTWLALAEAAGAVMPPVTPSKVAAARPAAGTRPDLVRSVLPCAFGFLIRFLPFCVLRFPFRAATANDTVSALARLG